MTPFGAGFTEELAKLANIIEKPLPATAGYRSDTRHFGAPEPGGPQNSGGDQLGPDGKSRGLEAPGDEPHPVKTANDPVQKTRVVRGITCKIEWPKGSMREYRDKKDPTKISHRKKMEADYGYIPGTKDNDGEQLDVYVGPDLKSDTVYMIRQLKDDGSFDEHKVMLGYDSWEAAKKAYLAHMPRKRLGRVLVMSTEHFKQGHLQDSKKNFRKVAALGVPDPTISMFTPRRKKGAKLPDGVDHQDCAQCSAADEVMDNMGMSASSAESHF